MRKLTAEEAKSSKFILCCPVGAAVKNNQLKPIILSLVEKFHASLDDLVIVEDTWEGGTRGDYVAILKGTD